MQLEHVELVLAARTWRYAEVASTAALDDWLLRLRRSPHCL